MGQFDHVDKRKGKVAGSKSSGVGKGYDAPFRGYINLNITAEQKEGFASWAGSESYWDALNFFAGDGVHLSLKFLERDACFLASGTQRREDSPNAGLVVTARAGDAAKAFARLLFCLTLLQHAERWEDVQPLADPDRW